MCARRTQGSESGRSMPMCNPSSFPIATTISEMHRKGQRGSTHIGTQDEDCHEHMMRWSAEGTVA